MQKMKVVGQTVQTCERKQTDGQTERQTDGRYQVHYLPRLAIDNKNIKDRLFVLVFSKKIKLH